jgi:hypothetical protein
MMTREEINHNAEGMKKQIAHFIDFSDGKAIMVDNGDWLLKLNYIDFLREIGVHFSVDSQTGKRYPSVSTDHESTAGGETVATLPDAAEMERAYLRSDPSYDGIFYLGVKSTGIFCRPSCGARKPLPRNVEYFASPREALFAGYRPCKRCRPLAAAGEPPVWAGKLLSAVEADPSHRFTDAELREIVTELLGLDGADPVHGFPRLCSLRANAYRHEWTV